MIDEDHRERLIAYSKLLTIRNLLQAKVMYANYVRCFFMPPSATAKKNLSARQAFKKAHKSGRAKFKNAQMRDALNKSAHVVYQVRPHKVLLTLIVV